MSLKSDNRYIQLIQHLELEAFVAHSLGDEATATRFFGMISDLEELIEMADERIAKHELETLIGAIYDGDQMGLPPDEVHGWREDGDDGEVV